MSAASDTDSDYALVPSPSPSLTWHAYTALAASLRQLAIRARWPSTDTYPRKWFGDVVTNKIREEKWDEWSEAGRRAVVDELERRKEALKARVEAREAALKGFDMSHLSRADAKKLREAEAGLAMGQEKTPGEAGSASQIDIRQYLLRPRDIKALAKSAEADDSDQGSGWPRNMDALGHRPELSQSALRHYGFASSAQWRALNGF
ncbi:hypothetical protein JCM6882_007056 [Rhodosporidiobolus microsporus]